jgi:hypothetical protein
MTAGIFIWLVTYFAPALSLNSMYARLSLGAKIASGLFPNMALHWAVRILLYFEWKGKSGYQVMRVRTKRASVKRAKSKKARVQ